MSFPEVNVEYENLLHHIRYFGTPKEDRTGVGTRSIFGAQLRYNLNQGFPLINTKRVHFKSIAYELLWFLQGTSNIEWLKDHGVTIWNEWADERGELGPVYGVQWRSWPTYDGDTIDQISDVLDTIRNNPDSRRMIVSAWNVSEVEKMALPPCHLLFQFYVANNKLSCQVYQRSADMFLGVPFNIASYALLTHMMAEQSGLKVGELIWVGGDCHVYNNHFEQVDLQLSRAPYPFANLRLDKVNSIFGYRYGDIHLENYVCHSSISAPVAV